MAVDIGSAFLQIVPSMRGMGSAISKDLGSTGATVGKKVGGDMSGGIRAGLSGLGKAIAPLAGIALAGVGVAKLTGAIKESFATANEWQRLNAQTATVLKSTGNAAGVTSKQVQDLASSLEGQTSTESEAIQTGANLLLTFTNLKNGVGKGNDIFNQTTKIMVDMSRALGQDTSASAIQLGKALNDPIKGVTALQRVGVSFTAQQKEQIKTMVTAGNTMGAQKLILAELNKEFGGSGAAYRATFAGQMYQIKDAMGDMGATAATAVMPVLKLFGGALASIASKISTAVMPLLARLGASLSVLADRFQGPLQTGIDGLATKITTFVVNGLGKLVTLFETLERVTANGINFDSIKAAIDKVFPGFNNLVTVFHLVTPLAPLIGSLLSAIGPQIEKILPSLTQAAMALFPAFLKILMALLPILPSVTHLIIALAPVITQLADAAAWLITYGLQPMVKLLSDVTGALTGTTTPVQVLRDGLAGKLGPAAQGIASILVNQVKPAVDTFMSGLTTAAGVVSAFAGTVGRGFSVVQAAVTAGMTRARVVVSTAWAAIEAVFQVALGVINALTGGSLTRLKGIVSANLAAVTAGFRTAWNTVVSIVTGALARTRAAVSAGIGAVVGIVRTLPGRAVAALGDLGSRMFGSGASLIGGFIKGIQSKVPAVSGAVGAVMGAASRLFPHSPAPEGPFSGRGWTLYSGKALGSGFADGITASTKPVKIAAAGMASAAAIHSSASFAPTAAVPAAAAAGTGFPGKVTLIDRNGSLLGHMDARIDRYDLSQQLVGAR